MALFDDAWKLQNSIIAHVTDESSFDPEEYTALRSLLVEDESLRRITPSFLVSGRTIEHLNRVLRAELPSYKERRAYISNEFSPLLDFLEFKAPVIRRDSKSHKIFISYSTKDKEVAGKLKKILEKHKAPSFLAHEDIKVSREWEDKILAEITSCSIFICLLSKNFLDSTYCIQETGIAASRENICIIPLSIDGQIPVGFIDRYQSIKIDPSNIKISDLLPALYEFDLNFSMSILLDLLKNIWGYREVENLLDQFIEYLPRLDKDNSEKLIEICIAKDQVYDAGKVANTFFPELIKHCQKFMSSDAQKFINQKIAEYS